MEYPLVTVVTPVYNTAEYLEECIRSVLAQDYPNLRYLVVDNCSTDGSAEIADRYANTDPRMEVTRNKSFLTQVGNYNHALRLASAEGKYAKIVQADDWIFPSCIRRMTEVAEEYPTVGIVGAYRLIGDRLAGDGLPVGVSFYSGKDVARRQLLTGDFYFGSPTSIMLRADVVRALTDYFDSGSLHEDTAACYRDLKTWDFGFVHELLTYSRIGNDSIGTRTRDFTPHALDKFIIISRFSSDFLEPREAYRLQRRTSSSYYRLLARAVFRFRGKPYWEYQRQGLAVLGKRVFCMDFVAGLLLELADILFNPKKTLGRIVHWAGNRIRGGESVGR